MSADITNRKLHALLRSLHACDGAWKSVPKGATGREAWNACVNGSHLLWLAERVGVDQRLLVRAAAACAETALQYLPDGEARPRLALEAARRWADDPTHANLERVRQARDAATAATRAYADAAYTAAYAAASAYAAYTAAYAADSAAASADSAAASAHAYADAAYTAAYAAAASAGRHARADALKRCADLVRLHISADVVIAAVHARAEVPA